MAPAAHSNFSVSVVLPASGCEMIAKVRRSALVAAEACGAGAGAAALAGMVSLT
jgi:hypothetical protein